MCSFGTAPGTITVTSQSSVLVDGKPAATVQDCQKANITPFAMCTSLANPQVASATAAALGVLTPQPCNFVPAGSWLGADPKFIAGGKPVITNQCTMMCSMGMGSISITNPGQLKTVIS